MRLHLIGLLQLGWPKPFSKDINYTRLSRLAKDIKSNFFVLSEASVTRIKSFMTLSPGPEARHKNSRQISSW